MRRVASIGIAVLISVILAAALMIPAAGHVGGTVNHLWGAPGHIKSKAQKLFYTKAQSNSKFAPRVFAVVASDGTLVRGSAATGATKPGTGSYRVAFSRNISGCAYAATIGQTGSSGIADAGFISVAGDTLNPTNGILVETRNTATSASDRPFHLVVMC